MAVTMKDVAEAAGVSVKTVSNVINGYEFIRLSTKERVLSAIADLGYAANLSARSLRSGRTHILGLVLSDISAQYYAQLASKVMAIASARGYRVVIEQTSAKPENELEALNGPVRQLADGLLFIPLSVDAGQIGAHQGEKPLVLLGEHVLDSRFDLVTMRNIEAAAAATSHLLQSGRRRIAVVGASPDDIAGSHGLRLRGYRQALEAASVDFDPRLVVPCSWMLGGGEQAVVNLLEAGIDFDAIFGLNDAMALGAMHGLLVHGIRVPDQVSVVGFDDIEESRFSSPSLTTVAAGVDEIAQRAVELLLRRIEEPEVAAEPLQLSSDFALKIRDSAP